MSSLDDVDVLILGPPSPAILLIQTLADLVGKRWLRGTLDSKSGEVQVEKLGRTLVESRRGFSATLGSRAICVGCFVSEDYRPAIRSLSPAQTLFELTRELEPATRRWATLVAAYSAWGWRAAALLGATEQDLSALEALSTLSDR